jgi:hypothetical protein
VGLRGTVLYIVVAIGTHEARLNPKSLICGKQADMTHEAGAVDAEVRRRVKKVVI